MSRPSRSASADKPDEFTRHSLGDGGMIDRLIAREGGFADHPKDKGGPTKYGITLRLLQAWRRRQGLAVPETPTDVRTAMRALTKSEARQIYRVMFVERWRLGAIASPALREHVLDAAVLHGPDRAVKWLQRVAGVKPDGIIGPRTAAALKAKKARDISIAFAAERIRFIGRVISRNPAQAVFAQGWLARATMFLL